MGFGAEVYGVTVASDSWSRILLKETNVDVCGKGFGRGDAHDTASSCGSYKPLSLFVIASTDAPFFL